MRVLYLTEERISFSETMVRGGAIHVQQVVQGLRKRGHDVLLLDWNEAPEVPFQVSVAPSSRFVEGAIKTTFRAISVGNRENVDIIISKTRKTYLPGLLAARYLGVPHAVHVGSSLDRLGQSPGDHLSENSLAIRLRAPHDGYLVVCNHIASQLHARDVSDSRIFNVQNAVDIERFHPDYAPTPLDTSYTDRIKEAEITLGYIGGLYTYKGVYDLQQAVAQCDAPVRVLIAGDGPERDDLETAFGDEADFLGSVPYEQIPAVYQQMDVLVLPSHTEGLPRVILEAQATATPVIATRVGGIPEVVTDGETGLLCPPRDPALLAEKLDCIATDEQLRHQLAEAGRDHASSFTWENLYDRYERALRRIIMDFR